MAGYVLREDGETYPFHVGTPDLVKRIRQANGTKRVITLQLDGDELEAALSGFEPHQPATKPKWVECAEQAGKALERSMGIMGEDKDRIVNEAHAWMRLADIYRFGNTPQQPQQGEN